MAPVVALVTCAALFALQHTTHALPAHQQVNRDLINNVVIHESPVSVSTEPTSASSWNQDSDAYWRLDSTDQVVPNQLRDHLDIDLQELESLFPGWAEYVVELWASEDEVTEDDLARLDERSGLGDRKLWQRNDKRAPQCGGSASARARIEPIRKEHERLWKKKVDLRKEEVEAKFIEDKEERESKLKAIEAEMKQVDEDIENLMWPWGVIGPPQCMDKRAVADVAGKDDPTMQELNKVYWRLVKKQGKLLKKQIKYEFIRDKEKKKATLAAVNAELERVEEEVKKDPKLAELKKEETRLLNKKGDIAKERIKATFIMDAQKRKEKKEALKAEQKKVEEELKKVKEEIKKLEKKGGH
ncbi:hypothetical protein V8F33_006497 [Rhypophila sp. PSN 637]